jgi:hypothetical protein
MKKFIPVIVILLLIISCAEKHKTYKKEISDGVEFITNENVPADPDFKLELKEAVAIDCNEISDADTSNAVQLNNVELDQDGNVYVLDSRRSKIHKFDKNGKRLLTFGGIGQGPGEFIGTGFFVVWHDTVYVPFAQALKIIKFDRNGKYITDKKYSSALDFPGIFWKSRNFVSGISFEPVQDEGPGVFKRNLNLFNDKFERMHTFYQDKRDFQNPVFNLNFVQNPAVAVSSDSLVYVPRYSTNEYVIDVFDFHGNKKQVIKKNYQRIPFTENEIRRVRDFFARNGNNNVTVEGKFKNSITLISMDKYDRLWVTPSKPEKDKRVIYDIFEKGVYLNTVEVPADTTAIVDFVENKLVAFDAVNNRIKYFDY